MKRSDDLIRENHSLRQCLFRLIEASLRINESLDFDTVLQEVVDNARELTDSRYGVITTLDGSGRPPDFVTSGVTAEDQRDFESFLPDGLLLFEYLSGLEVPLRVADYQSHVASLGLPGFLPMSVGSFLTAPIRHGKQAVGNISVARQESDREFNSQDEETLVMFASQAALVIANARQHREERMARVRLETLVDTSPVGVIVFDVENGRVASMNQEARRLAVGLQPDFSVERALEVLTFRRADGRAVSLEEFTVYELLGTGETVRAEEITLDLHDGRSVTALVNATPIQSEEGEIESFVVTIQDLTPLEELERLRAELLGMVSHELRIPLTSIRGSATTLLDEESALHSSEMRQFHQIILDQADHMRELISDLLDAARIKTGTLSVSPEPTDITALVDRARNMFLSAGGQNDLEINIAQDLPQVMADRQRIVQVISNLLSNAAKHSPASSPIGVRVVRKELHVAVSVTDRGRGIPAHRLRHVFNKYASPDSENRGRHLTGSGLGLAICKGIVEAHGGRIWAESDGPGLETRFTFTIPAVGESPAEPRPVKASAPRETGERTPILAVDDDPNALMYIRRALSAAGYAPVVTADPQDVEQLISEEKPHLVLLDLMLPGIDGIDLMQQILETADVPVIFVSAYGQEENVTRALDMGAVDYIVKPFAPSELAARIRAALRRMSGIGRLSQPDPYLLGDLAIDYAERRVTMAGHPVELTATEYAVFYQLSINAGLVLTHTQLLVRVWGVGHSTESGLVRTIVNRLRRKLGDDAKDPTYIFTVPRIGYRMPRGDNPATANSQPRP